MPLATLVLLLTAFAGAMLAVAILIRPETRTAANAFLAAAILVCALSSLDDYLMASGGYNAAPALIGYAMLLIPLIAPLFYLHVEALTERGEWRAERRHLRHLVLPVVCTLVVIPFLLLPGEVRLHHFNGTIEARGLLTIVGVVMLFLASLIQQAVYLRRCYRLMRQREDDLDAATASRLVWLRGFLLITIIFWLTFLASIFADAFGKQIGPVITATTAIIFLLALTGLGLFGLIRADALVRRPAELLGETANKYTRSALDEDDMDRIATKLSRALETDQAYLDPMLSLPRLAAKTGTSTNDLSQVINARMGLNYYELINRARIDHAKRLLSAPDFTQTVLDLCFEVGFNSKSVFNAAFKRETGTTPSLWRNDALSGSNP